MLENKPLVFLFIIGAILIFNFPVSAQSKAESLSHFEWENRLVLINTNDIKRVKELLLTYQQAIEERHILWFVLGNNEMQSNYKGIMSESLEEEVSAILSRFSKDNMVLVGKDGEVKSWNNGLDIESIFEQIDQMPMRQYERKLQQR